MIVAIASGKGGTGKTTVATNLAHVAPRPVRLLDCDVEEPNCHLFLRPQIDRSEPVETMVPVVDEVACDGCGKCAEICQFSAIVCLGGKPLLFPELCHACYGCALVCPQKAISEGKREVGVLETADIGGLEFVMGRLRIGEAMSPPLIRRVRSHGGDGVFTLIDAPPGTSCPVIESVRGCDYLILVTEPTPFGLHDLELAAGMARALRLSFGVVVNRAGVGDRQVYSYCRDQAIEILAEIPDDREVAEVYSRGEMICESLPRYETVFVRLLQSVVEHARRAREGQR